jgi:hypothetical protein
MALGWHVWTRHRLGLTLCAGYWLLVVILGTTLPAGSSLARAVVPVLLTLCFAAYGYLIMAFSFNPGARLEARESCYPARLWTVPLRTWSLVGWPMLWGTAVLASAWLTMAWAVFRWRDLDMSILYWWPALLLAVTLAWVQALAWVPFPLPGLRLLVLIPLIGAGLLGPELLVVSGTAESVGYGLLAAQLPAAYLAGVYGVSRARRGDVPSWTWPGWRAWLRWVSAPVARPPFASPAGAQRWFEWRRGGLAFPIMTFATALFWLPTMPITAGFLDDAARGGVHLVPPWLLGEVGGLGLTVAAFLLFLPLTASACGPELGKLPGTDRARGLSSFLATRPVSVAALVRAKFETAALGTLAGWSVAAVGLLLWLALGGHAAEVTAHFDALQQRHPPGLFWGWAGLLVAGALVLTWLQIVQGLWLGLVRHTWVTAALAVGLLGFIGLAFLLQWLAKTPAYWPAARGLLPWLAAAVVVLKGLAAFWSLRTLRRRGLLSSRDMLPALE